MKYKFFAIPARSPAAAEDELNAFCSSHRVTFIDKHLVADGADSFWSVCVSWLDGEAAPSELANNRNKPAIDYKNVLSPTDFSLYLELRNYRKELAEQQNVPPYALFTNDQLANMIQQRVNSKSALQRIPGVGKSRIDKYGDAFLHRLNELWGQAQAEVKAENETGTDQP
jgi:superfamily II DNA helicase RecQ